MRRGWIAFAAGALILMAPAYADLEIEDYAPTAGMVSATEQAQVARRIETEQEEERERMRKELEEATRKAAAEQARLNARPYPERLTALRCTRCHAATYLTQWHTWIGWSLVTLRMRYLNGAVEISEAERQVIAAYLAAKAGANGAEAVKEYGALTLATGMPFAVVGIVAGLRRRYRIKNKETRPT